MPYLHIIWTKLNSKGGKIKGLDVTFQMHSEAKIFDIIKYLKNEKNQKLKKKRKEKKIGKMAQKGPKWQKGPDFFKVNNPENKTKKWALLNWILSSRWKDTACDTHANKKLKNIENNLKMPYLYFISTNLDLKSGQIKGLDITFQIHSISKMFDIVKYLKN